MFERPNREITRETLIAGGSRSVRSPQTAASHGLARMFGLDPRAVVLAVLVDLMVFAGDTFSLETLVPLGIVVAAVLGFIVYKMQRKYQNDDHDSALIKALIIGLLTAIPFPLTPLIAIPSGIVGIATAVRRNDR
jgi:chromate transport protein ChrA